MNEYHILEFILLAGVIVGKACGRTDYIISPVINDECLREQCLTLSQFATNSTYIGPNTTLIFLDGDHFLKSDLNVTGTINFFISVSSDNLVSIICEPSTELSFTKISYVHIKGIRFLNCIFGVFHATVEDCSFELQNGMKTIQLVRTNALIKKCSLVNVNSRNETVVTVSQGNVAFEE